jgi:hypothetical protein
MSDTGQCNGCRQAGSTSPDYSDAEGVDIGHHLVILDDARPLARKLPIAQAF